jgi:hypothetical protein
MSTISAGTTSGTALVNTGDTTGALVLKTNTNTTALTLDTSGNAAFSGNVAVTGNVTVTGTLTALNNHDPFTKYDASLTLTSGIGTSIASTTLQLTSTTELLFLQGGVSGNLHAVVWDNTAKTFGTPVLIRSLASTVVGSSLISSTSVLVCSLANTSTALETVVLTISGTTITVNTAVATTLAANASLATNSISRLTKVGTSYVLSYAETTTTTNINFRAITVSGTTPTVGAQVTYSSGTTSIINFAYSSTILLTINTDSTTLRAQAISVSGSTLTLGTEASLSATATAACAGVLASGRVCIAFMNTFTNATLASVTGTVVTLSTPVSTGVSMTGSLNMQVIGSQAFIGSTGGIGINVVTDTAGVITAGTAITIGTPIQGLMMGSDGTNVYFTTLNSGQLSVASYGIVSGSPVMNDFWGGCTQSNPPGMNASFGAYNANYANIENAPSILKTTAGKYTIFSPTTSTIGFIPAFDSTAVAGTTLVFSPCFTTTGFVNSIKSSLNNFSGFSIGGTASLATKLKVQRIELN